LALACRYNVRDLGFVDLEPESYRLFGFVRADTQADTVALLRETPAAALQDCNIAVEIINIDQQTNHVALKHLPAGAAGSFPVAVLVSPDGQTLPLSLARSGQTFREGLAAALAEVASSPARETILRAVGQAFGAVLLLEGDTADANTLARQAITRALEQTRAQMKSLPKAIAEPPVMIVLDAPARTRERILLWSLGLDTASQSQPSAAVLYGKARWIGPLMKGEEITERNVTGILSIIGADCECGMDISWTRGTRLPVRWDERLHAQVAKGLGFDPESPMVKLEASRIIERGSPSTSASAGNQNATLPQGPSSTAETSVASHSKMITANTRPVGEATAFLGSAQRVPNWHRLLVYMAGLAVIASVSAGLVAFVRAARRKR
jgi:hypothetical protein